MIRGEVLKAEDPFLSDPDNLHYNIKCVSCRKDLWEMKILKRSGNIVLSTETHCVSPNTQAFDRKKEWCPLCGCKFYGESAKGQMYLIHDLVSGITRLV